MIDIFSYVMFVCSISIVLQGMEILIIFLAGVDCYSWQKHLSWSFRVRMFVLTKGMLKTDVY